MITCKMVSEDFASKINDSLSNKRISFKAVELLLAGADSEGVICPLEV